MSKQQLEQPVAMQQPPVQQSEYALLMGAIAQLETCLNPFFSAYESDPASTPPPNPNVDWPADWGSPRLNLLASRLKLSAAEVAIVLLCAGVELAPHLAQRCGNANGSDSLNHVSPQLIMQALGEGGVQALDPVAPIRTWQLIALEPKALALSAIRLDRAILHFLMGHTYQDPLFLGRSQEILPQPVDPLPASYQALIGTVQRFWLQSQASYLPVQLCGQATLTQQQVVGLLVPPSVSLHLMPASALPVAADELYVFCLRWRRLSYVQPGALLIDCHALKLNDTERLAAIAYLLENLGTPFFLLSHERLNLPTLPFTVEVPYLDVPEQKALWQAQLGDELPEADWGSTFSNLVAQFNLSASGIAAASQRAMAELSPADASNSEAIVSALWDSCRSQSRTQLEGFAKRIEPKVSWDDLVLPEKTVDKVKQIIAQVRARATVYDHWELGGRSRRGLGITAMFYGLSGTGKTTAAELIAKELNLDLYRIDLSAIVSKYIGETEKNLSKIFAAAEAAGAILQFDEADAIVGKRSAVKDARDRYANMEVSYLLQRMEAYPGLAILTTNLPNSLDSAFLRRLRFSVEFTVPDYELRMKIWEKVYGDAVPTDGLSVERLAMVYMNGATIKNIAMAAAFLAADEGKAIGMGHLYLSLIAEFRKLGLNLPKDMDLWEPPEMKEAREQRQREPYQRRRP